MVATVWPVRSSVELWQGDCRRVLTTVPAGSVDAVVTDPPYELAFMGKRWDASGIAYNVGVWAECLRVLKPGGYLLAFGGTRTYHRMTCAMEDAGFEIRDSIHWVYGSGFPKSHNVGKLLDKAAGATREVLRMEKSPYRPTATNMMLRPYQVDQGFRPSGHPSVFERNVGEDGYLYNPITAPATDVAKQWEGWGTALKPAHEPIVVARKPLCGTVAANVLKHGTGAINVDGCRVDGVPPSVPQPSFNSPTGLLYGMKTGKGRNGQMSQASGRWPPNLLLTHDPDCTDSQCVLDCAVREMDEQSGVTKSSVRIANGSDTRGIPNGPGNMVIRRKDVDRGHADSGGASRFFPIFRYQAKAPRSERPQVEGVSAHPTVKPLDLMRWLIRLVTPPGGLVLDPFAGTGTTLEAAVLEGCAACGVEQDGGAFRQALRRLDGQDRLVRC